MEEQFIQANLHFKKISMLVLHHTGGNYQLGSLLRHSAANLSPAYFALVMATGTLSVAANSLGFRLLALSLLFFNIAAYLVLWLLTLIRVSWYFPRIISDLSNHEKGPGFFTLVAGTGILGSQLVSVLPLNKVALLLWFFSILLWIIIMYSFFVAVITRKEKPDLKEGINGAWLIAAVATQSVSMLGTSLSPYVESGKTVMLFFTLCMYLLGCMLYLNIITLIFYRFTFLKLEYSALTPPYWINMGAVAITTLAGSTLLLQSKQWSMLGEITPFLKGFTLFFWVTGSWWIPLLLILMIWRLVYHRLPIPYNAKYWSMVFPLAMYTTSTYKLSQALELPFLTIIPRIFIFIALATWIFGLLLLLRHLFTAIATHYSQSR